jgi:predicted nucleic acid-binding protein
MDVCCLNRPFDDMTRDRIHLEAEAVLAVLARCQGDGWNLLSSGVIDVELSKLPDPNKLEKVRNLYSVANEYLPLNAEAECLAKVFQEHGIKPFDSLHLALATVHAADIFLTTDDKLLRLANSITLSIQAANPAAWFMEALYNEY